MRRLLLVWLLCATAFAADRKVFIQNDSGYQSVYDAASTEARKHFSVVTSRHEADLVFVFTRRDSNTAHTNGQLDSDGSYSSQTSVPAVIELDVLNRETGDKVWSNSRQWASPYPQPALVSMWHRPKPPSNKLVEDYIKSSKH